MNLFYGFVISTLSMIILLLVCMIYTALSLEHTPSQGSVTPTKP